MGMRGRLILVGGVAALVCAALLWTTAYRAGRIDGGGTSVEAIEGRPDYMTRRDHPKPPMETR